VSAAKKIQYLHLANMAWFVVLGIVSLFVHAIPGWAGLVGVGLLYAGLFIETVWVRRLMEGWDGPTPPQITSLMLTRLLIGAMSVVVIGAFLGRLGL
jgi:hypothetical protein